MSIETIETVLLPKMALHSLLLMIFFSGQRFHSICFTMRSNVFVCKPVAPYYKKLFYRIMSRLGIERDVILFGV